MVAEAPSLLASKLKEGGREGGGEEGRERLLGLGVLSFLALENMRDANALMQVGREGGKEEGGEGMDDEKDG